MEKCELCGKNKKVSPIYVGEKRRPKICKECNDKIWKMQENEFDNSEEYLDNMGDLI